MKKIAFLNLNDNSYGGVTAVNHTLMKSLISRGYQVESIFLRWLDQKGLEPIPGVGHFTVRKEEWYFTEFSQIISACRNGDILSAVKMVFARLRESIRYTADLRKIHRYLCKVKPDHIVVSHYLLLPAVPKKYLHNAYMHIHTSFDAIKNFRKNYSVLLKYNGKINFIFLSENMRLAARKDGFKNTFVLYNPIKFPLPGVLPVKEKKIAVITRLSEEKRLPKMVITVANVLKKHPDWSFEIYGSGKEDAKIAKAMEETGCGKLCGSVSHPEDILSSASLTLNTSLYEGFSLSIIEAAGMGVPTVAFLFGEAAREEILHGKTGILIPMDDFSKFEEELDRLLSDESRLAELSQNAFTFAKQFSPENTLQLFEKILDTPFQP